jgi:hypothetical protein
MFKRREVEEKHAKTNIHRSSFGITDIADE